MRIKIEHIPNTYNYGSLMMAVNTLVKLANEINDVELYVDTATEKDFERLIEETKLNNLYRIHELNQFNKFRGIIKKIKVMKKERELYDMKIVLGGDDISEYYGKVKWLVDFPLMNAESKEMPTILLGQTIGPFTSYNRYLAKGALNKTKIYTRDDKCLKYLENLGVETASVGRDLAFLELPNNATKTGILERYNLKAEDYITIVPSGLTKGYTKNLENYLKQQVNIISELLMNKQLDDKKIVLLPHVLLPKPVDDRLVVREIMSRIDDKLKNRIIAIDDEMLASEAREILGNGIFTITGRMHAAVSTFYMRKPAISLSYSVKYEGVIADGLKMRELVIESANERLWTTGEINKYVQEKVKYLLDNYDEIIKKIDINVSKTTEIAKYQLNDLVSEVKKVQDRKREAVYI